MRHALAALGLAYSLSAVQLACGPTDRARCVRARGEWTPVNCRRTHSEICTPVDDYTTACIPSDGFDCDYVCRGALPEQPP